MPCFYLGQLVPGYYTLDIYLTGYNSARIDDIRVEPGKKLNLGYMTMPKGGVFAGWIVDGDSGQAVGNCRVGVRYEFIWSMGPTRDDGKFGYYAASDERFSFIAVCEGYRTRIVPGLTVSTGQRINLGTIEVTKVGQEAMVEYTGVGMTLDVHDDLLVVEDVVENRPAAAAGITEGAVITRIDDTDASQLGLYRSVQLIRGDDATEVTLWVRLDGVSPPVRIRLERQIIIVPGGEDDWNSRRFICLHAA